MFDGNITSFLKLCDLNNPDQGLGSQFHCIKTGETFADFWASDQRGQVVSTVTSHSGTTGFDS